MNSHEVIKDHKISINYLMIEVYKYFHGLFSKLMTGIFTLRKSPRSVHFRVDAIAFRATQLLQKVPTAIKDSSSIEIFKAKIKLCSSDDNPFNLCKRFITNIGYIYDLYD